MSSYNEIKPSDAEAQRRKVAEEIAKLKAEHEALKNHLEEARQWLVQHYLPAWTECAIAEADLAKEIELAAIKVGLSKADYARVGEAIQKLLQQAQSHFQSSKENEELLQRWQSERKEEDAEAAPWTTDEHEQASLEIEGMAELEKLDSVEISNLAAAARKLYLSLAKRFHPDAEPDPEKKLEKEEVMKKVISAFHNQDIETLLRLDAAYRIDGQFSPDLEALEEPLLNLLQRQHAQSKVKLAEIKQRIKDSGLPSFNPNKPDRAMRELKKQGREIKAYSHQLHLFGQHAKSISTRKEIMDFVERFL